MLKTNKVIFIDTITREFIKFAKIMGIFPSICYYFKENDGLQYWGECKINYFEKRSFYDYARQEARHYRYLNDDLIKYVYLFSDRWFSASFFPIDKFENTNELADLFLSHLRDKGYPKYIKIIH